jgi:hypothetical protein
VEVLTLRFYTLGRCKCSPNFQRFRKILPDVVDPNLDPAEPATWWPFPFRPSALQTMQLTL